MVPKKTAKRYTEDERTEILDFIEKYNQENGRGGQTVAIKKFGVTALTIGSWKKRNGKKAKTVVKSAKKKFRNPAKLIERLHEVMKEIEKAETSLKKLSTEAKELRKEIRSAIDS